MRYHDKKTLILNKRHLDKEDSVIYSDRVKKRLEIKKQQDFIDRFSSKLDRDFWKCLSESDRDKIVKEYYYIQQMSRHGRSNRPDWDRWVKMVKKDYLSAYRDSVINKLLDE